jgi:membrane protease YdiL (CAAX protease family)
MNHLECTTQKKNEWYLYLFVILLCLLVSNTIGAIPLIILSAETDGNLVLFSMLFPFVCFLATAIFFIKIFHNRTWTQVINGTSRIRLSRFFFGIAVWGTISLICSAVTYLTEPESLTFRFEAGKFIVLLFISVIFIPLQTTAEEFIFRGYLMQGVASWTKSRWWALVIPSVLFGLLHGINPEIKQYGFWVMMPQYIFMGLMFGAITLFDDGAEIAMGMHAINNITGCTLVTYESSALQTDALFIANEINPAEDLKWLLLTGVTAFGIFALKYKWNFRIFESKKTGQEKDET